MRSSKILVFSSAVAAFASMIATAEAQEDDSRFSFSLEAGIRWDGNIGLTPDDPAEQPNIPAIKEFDDTTTRIAATLNFDVLRSASQEIVLSATPFYAAVSDLDGLSNYGIEVAAAYRGEFGSDFTDPWYALQIAYTTIDFDSSRVREGSWFEGELTLGKRFSPAFGLSVGYRFFDRSQDNKTGLCPNNRNQAGMLTRGECPASWDEDQVFEQDRWGAFAHADFFVGDNTELFLEYSYWDGDTASTGAFRKSGMDFLADDDEAFGTYLDARGNTRLFRVWKVQAKQHVIEAGITRHLTDSLSLGLTYMNLSSSDVSGDKRIGQALADYDNNAVELTLTYGSR